MFYSGRNLERYVGLKVLIVTDSYPPEIRSASKLVYDLRNYLIGIGFDTDVITTEAKYNIDKNFDFIDDLAVSAPVRVKVLEHHNVPYVIRGIAQIMMPLNFIMAFKKHLNRNYDIVIIYSPPLTLGLFGAYLKRNFADTTVLNVQDLFPQNAIDLGILKNILAIKFFRYIEKLCYRFNDIVTFHSKNNLELSNRKFSADLEGKSIVMHNWQKFSGEIIKNQRYVREKYSIGESKRIAIFAGVLGPAQGLQNLIALADEVKHSNPEWHFLVLGDGSEKIQLMANAKTRNLTNIQFEEFVNPDEYTKILSGCQLGLVFLSENNKTPVIPGKILGYMEAKIPSFCVLNRQSDAHELVRSAGCGSTTFSDLSPKEISYSFAELIAHSDRFGSIGSSGYDYVKKNFEISVVVDELLKEINQRKVK